MGVWSDRVVPVMTDRLLRGKELGEVRGRACAPLRGEVLEIGFGGGLNVRWYPDAVASVAAVEPSDAGWGLSGRRRTRTDVPIRRRGLDGQALDEEDDSYDSVLSTFTLCTIPDVRLALAEVRRVLRPGGAFCFLEHGLAPEPGVQAWQRRLEPLQRRLGGGCHLTRDIPGLVAEAGFDVEVSEEGYLLDAGALGRPWGYGFRGVAR